MVVPIGQKHFGQKGVLNPTIWTKIGTMYPYISDTKGTVPGHFGLQEVLCPYPNTRQSRVIHHRKRYLPAKAKVDPARKRKDEDDAPGKSKPIIQLGKDVPRRTRTFPPPQPEAMVVESDQDTDDPSNQDKDASTNARMIQQSKANTIHEATQGYSTKTIGIRDQDIPVV